MTENQENEYYPSDDEIEEAHASKRARRSVGREYTFVKVFDTLSLAKEHLKNNSNYWTKKEQRDTLEGVKLVYKCRTNDGHCGKLCYILCHNDSLKVSLFVDSLEHDHPEVNAAGLDPQMKAEVRRLFEISK